MMSTFIHSSFNWVKVPKKLLNAFTGKSNLPIYEINKDLIGVLYARVRPLNKVSSTLTLSAWRLAHAIKKTDCARGAPYDLLQFGVVGFLLEHMALFEWNTENLRLEEGMADYYADVTRTSLAGRIGQGMTILFMEHLGYAFTDRFSTFLKKNPVPSATYPKQPKIPDFVCENHHHQKALAESKGGFVAPGGLPEIKGDLRDALNQLDGWDQIFPQITKSYAVGTYFREILDMGAEPSLVAYVDPESEEPSEPSEFPLDAIRRANYAAWVAGMGYDDVANRILFDKDSQQTRIQLYQMYLGERKYAFEVMAIRPQLHKGRFHIGKDFPHWFYPFFGGIVVEIMGLELEVLKSLSPTQDAYSEYFMDFEPISEPEMPLETEAGAFTGSVFSDGTVLGELEISFEWFSKPKILEVTF